MTDFTATASVTGPGGTANATPVTVTVSPVPTGWDPYSIPWANAYWAEDHTNGSASPAAIHDGTAANRTLISLAGGHVPKENVTELGGRPAWRFDGTQLYGGDLHKTYGLGMGVVVIAFANPNPSSAQAGGVIVGHNQPGTHALSLYGSGRMGAHYGTGRNIAAKPWPAAGVFGAARRHSDQMGWFWRTGAATSSSTLGAASVTALSIGGRDVTNLPSQFHGAVAFVGVYAGENDLFPWTDPAWPVWYAGAIAHYGLTD